jgi:hypothetical protein
LALTSEVNLMLAIGDTAKQELYAEFDEENHGFYWLLPISWKDKVC